MKESATHWKLVKRIFNDVLQKPAWDRADFLRVECGSDAGLRREIERLLECDEQACAFLETPAAEDAARLIVHGRGSFFEGRLVGPYRLLREIGHGGMGTVYLAERADELYQRRVAIKLLRPGIDQHLVSDRFRHERQILAGLDHPNIAKLLDGGTSDDGSPYFVMDFIKGLPIDRYCEANTLSIRGRLELFRTVCSAVQYAHQNLVIHRDLKPSNILVTADGVPRLLDFGIAKIIDPASDFETVQQTASIRFMTLDYASPEQLRGQPVTTASDVYSLGVLLYRLLTGQSPYRLASSLIQDLERAICDQSPEKPSAACMRDAETIGLASGRSDESPAIPSSRSRDKLRRQLAGDLDNILLMALRKEPDRRYSSPDQFSEDLRRYLTGRPVIARRETPVYRAGKFVRRNKAAVTVAMLMLMLLVGGIVSTWRQARIAERRLNEVRRLANSLLFEMHDAIQNLPGATSARELLVRRALEYLDELAHETGNDFSLQLELAAAYERIGDVQGNPSYAHLGDNKAGLEGYSRARAIYQSLVKRDSSLTARRGLARSSMKLGDIITQTEGAERGLEMFKDAMAIYQKLSEEDPSPAARRDLGMILQRIGDVEGNGYFANLGHTAAAISSLRSSLEVFESLAKEQPESREAHRDLAILLVKLAQLSRSAGDAAAGREYHARALAIREELASADPTDAIARRDLALSYNSAGEMLCWSGQTAAGLAAFERALQIFQSLAEADPANVLARTDLALSLFKSAGARAQQGDYPDALGSYRKALNGFEAVEAIDPKDLRSRRNVILCYQMIGETQAELHDAAGALKSHRQALALSEELLRADASNAQASREVMIGHENVGDGLVGVGSFSTALESYRSALALADTAVSAEPDDALRRMDLARICGKLGTALSVVAAQSRVSIERSIGQWREARSAFSRAGEIFSDLRARGALRSRDLGEPERIKKEIARCDESLLRRQADARRGSRRAVNRIQVTS